jgi:hypothetical protein
MKASQQKGHCEQWPKCLFFLVETGGIEPPTF